MTVSTLSSTCSLNRNILCLLRIQMVETLSILFVSSNELVIYEFMLEYLTFLFGFSDEEQTSLLDKCLKRTYSPHDLNREKGGLNYPGEAFVSLDQPTNNNINSF